MSENLKINLPPGRKGDADELPVVEGVKPWEQPGKVESAMFMPPVPPSSEGGTQPSKLKEFFGDKEVPEKLAKRYEEASEEKKVEILKKITEGARREAEKKEQRKAEQDARRQAPKEKRIRKKKSPLSLKENNSAEEPFDSHSVRSSVPLQTQMSVQETLKRGESSPKKVLKQERILVDKDVNVRDAWTPFEPDRAMQEDMNELVAPEHDIDTTKVDFELEPEPGTPSDVSALVARHKAEAQEEIRQIAAANAAARISTPPMTVDPYAKTVNTSRVDTRTAAERLAEAEEGLRLLPNMFGAGGKHTEVASEEEYDDEDVPTFADQMMNDSPESQQGWHEKLQGLVDGYSKNLESEKKESPKEEEVNPPSPEFILPAVDASKFAAPQYAPRGMQEEMNELNSSAKPVPNADEVPGEADIPQRLRAEIRALESEAAKPGARKGIESDILKREAELRTFEAEKSALKGRAGKSSRVREIHQRLSVLEREAASPADYRHNHDELENEVLTLENELRQLETGTPASEKKPDTRFFTVRNKSPDEEGKSAEEPPEGEDEKQWSPSPLEEQRSAVLGELYEQYRHSADGPLEFNAIPDEIHKKVQDFFDTHSKSIQPDGTIPEDAIDAFLAELRAAGYGTDETVPEAEEALPAPAARESPATLEERPAVSEEPEKEEKRKDTSYRVETEIRDDNLEYVSIIPNAFEATPFEWREKLKKLIGKFTK